jgi:dipeptidyl aminopeptidase/acylaminoacyl peptidase
MMKMDCLRRTVGLGLLALGWMLSLESRTGAQGSRADYERADTIGRRTGGARLVRGRVEPRWSPDGKRFWYRNELGSDGRAEFVVVEPGTGRREAAFDAARLVEPLGKALGREGLDAARLPVERLDWADSTDALLLRADGKWYRLDLATYGVTAHEEAETATVRSLANVPRRSRASADETEIVIRNRTERPVRLEWLDTEGNAQSYGRLAPGEERRQHTFVGHVWSARDDENKEVDRFEAGEGADSRFEIGTGRSDAGAARPEAGRGERRGFFRRAEPRPEGAPEVVVKDFNLFVRDPETKELAALTTDGTAEDSYGGRLMWSPDGSRLVVMQTVQAAERQVTIVESSPRDQLQPKTHTFGYNKPGDPLPRPRPRLFDMKGRKRIEIEGESLYENPFELRDERWSADGSRFTFLYNERGHQALRLIAIDGETGKARALIDEHSPTFIDYSSKTELRWLDGRNELVWMSERSGWNHLYRIDATSGEVKNAITQGEWVVKAIETLDEEAGELTLAVLGIDPAQDPYHVHYVRVKLDGTGLVRLTEGDGTHRIQKSPDGQYYIDTYSRVDMPPVAELRRWADGGLVCGLEKADDTEMLEEAGLQRPERFVAKGRDGTTDIYGIIVRPSHFDSSRKYPVIEAIYAGPQDAFVPKSYQPVQRVQGMAELGFILVQIDGMGTNWRSKAFHNVCWKNLADAGLPDRVAWIRKAAETRPEMDVTRVGIYGGSAGGQNALGAVLTHGDFYKAAVADCGCHDNRMDKIWWNEQWMGWPVGPEYEANSNVTLAPKLEGNLLLIVGELDRNVDPASTMQVVNALIRADKDFDLLVVPGAGHGAGGSPYGTRRTRDFFVRHLLGVEPRHE